MRTLKRRAFFDLDGTVIEEISGIELARILTELETDRNKWQEFWENQGLLRNESTNYDYALTKLSEYFAKGVKNTKTKIVWHAVKELQKCLKVREGFSELHSWLVEKKFEIFILTASPIEVFEAIPNFQFAETFGLILEKNHEYTGRCILPMTTKVKREKINEKNQNSSFSFGVSDSIHDLKAYEELDMKFLLDHDYPLPNELCIRVNDFHQIRRIVKDHLNGMRK